MRPFGVGVGVEMVQTHASTGRKVPPGKNLFFKVSRGGDLILLLTNLYYLSLQLKA